MNKRTNFTRTLFVSIAMALVIAVGQSYADDDKDNNDALEEVAYADIYGCRDEGWLGKATLVEKPSDQGVKTVVITMKVRGLENGMHAVHIHEKAECEPCGEAGGHFDPGPDKNSSPDGNHPFHMGDLVNIRVRKNLVGRLKTVTTRITLSSGPLSVFDEDGSAFIIHDSEDTFCPDGEVAGCAGGSRAACGVIELM